MKELEQKEMEQKRLRRQRDTVETDIVKLVLEMQKLDFTKIDYTKMIRIMKQGLSLLGEIQIGWANMYMFYSKMSNRIEKVIVDGLADFTIDAQAVSDAGGSIEGVQRLSSDAVKLHETAFSLHVVARIYQRMSQVHVVPQLMELPKLLGNNAKQAAEQLRLLQVNAENAMNKVKDLAERQRNGFEKALAKEVAKLRKELGKQQLPPTSTKKPRGFGRDNWFET